MISSDRGATKATSEDKRQAALRDIKKEIKDREKDLLRLRSLREKELVRSEDAAQRLAEEKNKAYPVDDEELLVRPQNLSLDPSRSRSKLVESESEAAREAARHASAELRYASAKLLKSVLPFSASLRLADEEPAPLSLATKDAPLRQRLPWELRMG